MAVTTHGNAVHELVSEYVRKLEAHPIRQLCERRSVPRPVLEAFARAQFVDCTMWVPMLSLIKGRLESPLLKEAVRKNILDEVGDSKTPHVTLCYEFLQSLGVPTQYSDYQQYSPASVYPVEVMMAIANAGDDAIIGGWLLAQEVLVPVFFRMFREALGDIPGIRTEYLTEHEEVDAVDHSQWILQGVEPMLSSPESAAKVLAGVDIGGRATIAVPDVLYGQALRLKLATV